MTFLDRGDPDFVNDEGVKWWRDEQLTSHARGQDQFGIALDMYVYLVEEKNGILSYVIINKNGVIYSNQSLEEVAAQIDIIKLRRLFENNQTKRRAIADLQGSA